MLLQIFDIGQFLNSAIQNPFVIVIALLVGFAWLVWAMARWQNSQNKRFEVLQEDATRQLQRIASLETKQDQQANEIGLLRRRQTDLEIELAKTSTDRDRLKEERDVYKNKLDAKEIELKNKQGEFEKQIEALRTEFDQKMQALNDKFQPVIESMTVERDNLRIQVQERDNKISNLNSRLEKLEGELVEAKKANGHIDPTITPTMPTNPVVSE